MVAHNSKLKLCHAEAAAGYIVYLEKYSKMMHLWKQDTQTIAAFVSTMPNYAKVVLFYVYLYSHLKRQKIRHSDCRLRMVCKN